MRAIAITLVLLFHYSVFFDHPNGLNQWTSFGWTGVDLFFVLSGYLISAQLLAAKNEGRNSAGELFHQTQFSDLAALLADLDRLFLDAGVARSRGTGAALEISDLHPESLFRRTPSSHFFTCLVPLH